MVRGEVGIEFLLSHYISIFQKNYSIKSLIFISIIKKEDLVRHLFDD
jgi:hypothetical protein